MPIMIKRIKNEWNNKVMKGKNWEDMIVGGLGEQAIICELQTKLPCPWVLRLRGWFNNQCCKWKLIQNKKKERKERRKKKERKIELKERRKDERKERERRKCTI